MTPTGYEVFMRNRVFLTGSIGNILEHYSNALFGLLAPFIAPLFFHDHNPFTALILTYAILPLGMVSRPVGALFFGWMGDRVGRAQALSFSLFGMAISTAAMGCLPLAKDVGVLAPLLLAFARLCQSFFAAGESSVGSIYVMENTSESKRTLASSLYGSSTVLGILLASGLVTIFSVFGFIEMGWRYLFLSGSLTGLIAWVIRNNSKMVIEPKKQPRAPILKEIIQHRRAFFTIFFAAGFSYATYSLPFVLMNGFIPLITPLTKPEVMELNTALLALDLLLLPLFGFLAQKLSKERVMLFGVLATIVTAIPLFSMLGPTSTLITVSFVRIMIVVFGVAFSAPYRAWAVEQVPFHCRTTVLSLGYSLGSQLIGTPAPAICLWIFHKTNWVAAPALYLIPVATLAMVSLYLSSKSKAPVALKA